MTLVSGEIVGLVNGVSQQDPSLRLPSQLEDQVNGWPSLTRGLTKRPPLRYVTTITSQPVVRPKLHFAYRDNAERYSMVFDKKAIYVVDRDTGEQKTVNAPDGMEYINTSNALEDIKAMTVADYTFVLNSTKTVQMTSKKSPGAVFRSILSCKFADYATRFAVYVDGDKVADLATSDSDVSQTQTTWIAGRLAAQMVVPYTAPDVANEEETPASGEGTHLAVDPEVFTVTHLQSSIMVERVDGGEFTISAWDSRDGKSITVTSGEVQDFSDLPLQAPDEYFAKVLGEPGTQEDEFYVRFRADDVALPMSEGVWEETVASDLNIELDQATMPHVLVREADGTFTFRATTWGEREVGDDISNAEPSFVGNKLNNMNFIQNRFTLLADTNVITSRTGEFFNFWRRSARGLFDDDRIDVAAHSAQVAKLTHSVSFDERLIVFSDLAQWALEGNPTLTPVTSSMTPLPIYQSTRDIEPVSVDDTLFFANRRGGATGIYEMQVIDESTRLFAKDVTDHVPNYLPIDVNIMATSSNAKTIFIAKDGASEGYFYNWHWNARTKTQSAWHKATFFGASLVGVTFVGTDMDVILVKNGKVILCRMDLNLGSVDEGLGYYITLDYRVTQDQCTTKLINDGVDTEVTLPLEIDNPIFVVGLNGNGRAGNEVKVNASYGNRLAVSGVHTKFTIGEAYTFLVVPSRFYYRKKARDGSSGPAVLSGHLKVSRALFHFSDTGFLRIATNDVERGELSETFNGWGMAAVASGGLGFNGIKTGSLPMSIHRPAKDVLIEATNPTSRPCTLIKVEWKGIHTERTR
jgi:hypothetical protein